jgi:pilus assembly protein CpaC
MQSLLKGLIVAGVAFLAIASVGPAPALADDDDDFGFAAGASIGMEGPVVRVVKIGLNKSVVIDLPRDARDILVSNPIIADAVIRTPRRIYVTGVAVGQSNVIIFDRAGQQILLLDLEVERDSMTLTRTLNRLIAGSAIDVEVVSDNIILAGTVRTAADARKAEDIAGIFANGGAMGGGGSGGVPSSIINMLAIEGEDQVQLKVTVAEVRRNVAKQLGISTSGTISIGSVGVDFLTNPGVDSLATSNTGGVLGGVGFSSPSFTIDAVIRALEQTNMIKTLAEPTLTAISGESASFLAGGEFPVRQPDGDGGTTTIFKPFGVALAFTPVVLSEGRISLRVKTEVSALGEVFEDGQGLTVRRAESTLELPSGGSMVLGGLIEDNVRQTLGAVPGLGRLPILGALFRSRDFQSEESELVIIVTPYLVSPVARSALAAPGQGFQPASDAQAVFLGNVNRVYGGPSDKPASYALPTLEGAFGFIFE